MSLQSNRQFNITRRYLKPPNYKFRPENSITKCDLLKTNSFPESCLISTLQCNTLIS